MEFIQLVPVAFSNWSALLWTTTCLVGCHGNLLSVIAAFRFSRVIYCLRICSCFSVTVVLLHNNASAAWSERTETGRTPVYRHVKPVRSFAERHGLVLWIACDCQTTAVIDMTRLSPSPPVCTDRHTASAAQTHHRQVQVIQSVSNTDDKWW